MFGSEEIKILRQRMVITPRDIFLYFPTLLHIESLYHVVNIKLLTQIF